MTITDDPPSILAERIMVRHPNKVYQPGRVCSVESCSTFLSRYNGSSECSVHESRVAMSGRIPSMSEFLR